MKKYAKIINDETKAVCVFTGSDLNWAKQNGFCEYEIEQDIKGNFYLNGFAPEIKKTYQEKRLEEYPSVLEQLDMIYWDKVNGTNLWQQKISEIKAKYPKE